MLVRMSYDEALGTGETTLERHLAIRSGCLYEGSGALARQAEGVCPGSLRLCIQLGRLASRRS